MSIGMAASTCDRAGITKYASAAPARFNAANVIKGAGEAEVLGHPGGDEAADQVARDVAGDVGGERAGGLLGAVALAEMRERQAEGRRHAEALHNAQRRKYR